MASLLKSVCLDSICDLFHQQPLCLFYWLVDRNPSRIRQYFIIIRYPTPFYKKNSCFLLGWPVFRCYVSCRECSVFFPKTSQKTSRKKTANRPQEFPRSSLHWTLRSDKCQRGYLPLPLDPNDHRNQYKSYIFALVLSDLSFLVEANMERKWWKHCKLSAFL